MLVSDKKIDLLSLTETWLHPDEYVSLNESTPPSHLNSHVPREFGRGGGVAAIFNSSLLINPKPKLSYHSFENLVLSLLHQSNKCQQPILFAVVYSAPGAYSEFLTEFPEFLSNLVLKTDKIIIVGDFNIHVDNTNDSCSVAFISILDSIGFSQCVHQPTHCCNHTLDLVLSYWLRGIIPRHEFKQVSRKLERKWRSNNSVEYLLDWKNSVRVYKKALHKARAAYYSKLREENKNNPRFLFSTVARLTESHSSTEPSIPRSLNSSIFMTFFHDKILTIDN